MPNLESKIVACSATRSVGIAVHFLFIMLVLGCGRSESKIEGDSLQRLAFAEGTFKDGFTLFDVSADGTAVMTRLSWERGPDQILRSRAEGKRFVLTERERRIVIDALNDSGVMGISEQCVRDDVWDGLVSRLVVESPITSLDLRCYGSTPTPLARFRDRVLDGVIVRRSNSGGWTHLSDDAYSARIGELGLQ